MSRQNLSDTAAPLRPLSAKAQAFFNELVARLPTFMSLERAGLELNVNRNQVYAYCHAGDLESHPRAEKGRTGAPSRKRDITGRSVARLAAELFDKALAAGQTRVPQPKTTAGYCYPKGSKAALERRAKRDEKRVAAAIGQRTRRRRLTNSNRGSEMDQPRDAGAQG